MPQMQFLCPNCSAPHLVSESDLAVKCRYCGTTFRTFAEERRYLLPAYYDSSRAIENFLLWVKKQLGYEESLPFHIYIKDAKLHFYPFWTSTISAKTSFKGVGEDARYENPHSGGYRTIHTVYREEKGEFERLFEYSIPASREVPTSEELVAVSRKRIYFSYDYIQQRNGILHGATLTREEAKKIMEENAKSGLSKMILREVVRVDYRKDELQYSDFTLVYVPVWRITYSFKGKDYEAIIDASSSRVLHATYPPDIAEKAGYLGVGVVHIGVGVVSAVFLLSLGVLPAATAFLGFLAAGLVYVFRGVSPARAGERVAEKSTTTVLRRIYRTGR